MKTVEVETVSTAMGLGSRSVEVALEGSAAVTAAQRRMGKMGMSFMVVGWVGIGKRLA